MSSAGKLVSELTVQKDVVLADYTPPVTTQRFYNRGGVLYWGSTPLAGTGIVVLITSDDLIPLFTVAVDASDPTQPRIGFTLKTVAANKVLIGPVSGADAAWAARLLAVADLPDLSEFYQAALGYDPENVENKATDAELGDSDVLYPSQKAVKDYVAAHGGGGAAGALTFQDAIDCSGNPNYPAADKGDVYVASVAGKIGGASGIGVEVGDTMYCKQDGTVSGDQATVGAYWVIIQANIDGAVIGPASAVGDRIVLFNSTTGKLIKDSGMLLSDLVAKGLLSGSGLTIGSLRLAGRWDASTGAFQEIQLGANLVLSEAGFLSASIGGSTEGFDIRAMQILGGI
jgi:hypothetical protein